MSVLKHMTFIEDKYLRVIVLEDGQTVYNAFFDRDFREAKP